MAESPEEFNGDDQGDQTPEEATPVEGLHLNGASTNGATVNGVIVNGAEGQNIGLVPSRSLTRCGPAISIMQ